MYPTEARVPKYINQILIDLMGETDNIVIVRDFNIPLIPGRKSVRKHWP